MAARSDARDSKSKTRVLKGTRLDLTLAAERVFATKGLQGATLREIREYAGQKNESVIHYHFGSREAIVESVLQLRSIPLDARRSQMLKQAHAESEGLTLSTEQVARCCLMPLAEHLLDNAGTPGHYMRFLVQLRVNREVWRQLQGRYGLGLNECLEALHLSKPYMPPEIINQRFVSVIDIQLNGLAALEQIQHKDSGFSHADARARIEDLVTLSASMLDAPLSPAALAAMLSSKERASREKESD